MEKKIERDLYISIPILFLLGTLFHFVFNWFNQVSFLAPFFPVNESIWEHTKLLIYPLMIFYISYYYLFRYKYLIDKESWFFSLTKSFLSSFVVLIVSYYTYSGILGKNIAFVNILLLLISLFVGQMVGWKTYQRKEKIPFRNNLILLFIILSVYCVLSYHPLHIDLFYDFSKRKYGF